MQQMIKRIISKNFVNLWSYKDPFLDFCFTKSWQLFRGAWNLLLFCPELLQNFSLSPTHCVRVVTKFSRSQQGVGVGRFSFLAPMTFVVARLSWHNEISWLCCPIHKNSSTLFIHLGKRPSKTAATFKSPQSCHWCCSYFMHLNNCFMLSYVSFIWTAWQTGTDDKTFPLWSKTAFRLLLDEPITSLYSSGSWVVLRAAIKSSVSLQ